MKFLIPMMSGSLTLALFLGLGFQAQQAKPKSKAKTTTTPAVEQYDPDHLGWHEVACGREKPGDKDACKCMEHRQKASDVAQAECARISDKKDRALCYVNNEACSIVPVDVDHAGYDDNGEKMPAQCKRSCTRARCECCKS